MPVNHSGVFRTGNEEAKSKAGEVDKVLKLRHDAYIGTASQKRRINRMGSAFEHDYLKKAQRK